MTDLDHEFRIGDVTVQIMKNRDYHVKCPLTPEPIISKCRPFEFYHLLERGDLCDIYLNLHRGCYAIFIADVLQKTTVKTIEEAREFVQNLKLETALESQCSFASFKRDARIPGFALTNLRKEGALPRTVSKIQSNAIVLNAPENYSKVSWLEFPPASLVEYNRKYLRIYRTGLRFYTEEEKAALLGWEQQRNIEAEQMDAISGSNSQLYRQDAYWKEIGMPYMYLMSMVRGLKRDFTENLVQDNSIKGELALEYKVDIPLIT